MPHSFFLHYINEYRFLGYAIVFFAMAFEGDATLFTITFLVHQRFLDIGDTFFVVVAGVLAGDIVWFTLGRKIIKPMSRADSWLKRVSSSLDPHLKERTFYTIFFSKFAYGFHHILLARAGRLNISPKKFVKSDILASTLWIIIVGGLGYTAGAAYSLLRSYIKFAEVGLLVFLVIFVVVDRFVVSKKIQKKLR